MDNSAGSKKCSKCHASKPLHAFRQRKKDSKGGKKGTLTDKCGDCMDQENHARARKRKLAAEEDTDNDLDNATGDLPPISLADFIDNAIVGMQKANFQYSAHVDCREHIAETGDTRERAGIVAAVIGDHLRLHWKCVPDF